MSLVYSPRLHSLGARIFPQLQIVQKRFNRKEEIYRYVEPHKFKKHMLTATQPYFRRKFSLPEETCKGIPSRQHPLLPLEEILVEELLADIRETNFILFIQYTYAEFVSDRVFKNNIRKAGGHFHALNNNIYREAMTRLGRLESLQLFCTRNALITGQYDDLSKCMIALRKIPEYVLLCGYVDDHLYNIDQLNTMIKGKSLDLLRANLVNTLNTHAINLSHYLKAYGDMLEKSDETSQQDT